MGLRSQLPDAVLLVLVAFAVVASLTCDRSAAGDRPVRRAGRHGAPVGRSGGVVWRLASVGARAAQGRRRPVALRRAERAPRSDHRRARRCASFPSLVVASDRTAGRRRAAPGEWDGLRCSPLPPGRLRRRLVAGAMQASGRRPTTTQYRRLDPAVGGRRRQRPPDPEAQHPPPRVRAGPHDVEAGGERQPSCRERRRAGRSDGQRHLQRPAGRRGVVDPGTVVPVRSCRRERGVRGLALRPALVGRPTNAQAAVRAYPRCARGSANPAARSHSTGLNAARLPERRLRALDAGSRSASRRCPQGSATRHRPRRLRLLRARYGRVVGAVIPSRPPAEPPRRTSPSSSGHRARARSGGLSRELADPEVGEQIARETGAGCRALALRRHARARGLGRRDVPAMEEHNAATIVRRLSRANTN